MPESIQRWKTFIFLAVQAPPGRCEQTYPAPAVGCAPERRGNAGVINRRWTSHRPTGRPTSPGGVPPARLERAT